MTSNFNLEQDEEDLLVELENEKFDEAIAVLLSACIQLRRASAALGTKQGVALGDLSIGFVKICSLSNKIHQGGKVGKITNYLKESEWRELCCNLNVAFRSVLEDPKYFDILKEELSKSCEE